MEATSNIINRTGMIYNTNSFSATFQVNYTGIAYGDASNVKLSENPIAGYTHAYTVMDINTTYKIKNYALRAGINNLTDKAYFTRRTDEYPGPSIIPAVGRSFYVGFFSKLLINNF